MTTETAAAQAAPFVDMPPAADMVPAGQATARQPHQGSMADDMGVTMSDLRVVIRHSPQTDLLFAAIAAAQAAEGYGDVEKTKTARIKKREEKGGGEYTYRYETLRDVIDATVPFLAKQGVAVMQFPFTGARAMQVRTLFAHKSGQWIYGDIVATITMPDPQDVGGAISYLRRYALKAQACVAAEDEQNEEAKGQNSADRAPREEAPRPAQRASEQPQERGPSASSAPAQGRPPADVAQAAPKPVGLIKGLDDRGGGLLVRLDSGYVCSTKNQELVAALKGHYQAERAVELRCRPSSDPAKFPPVLEEISVQQAKGA